MLDRDQVPNESPDAFVLTFGDSLLGKLFPATQEASVTELNRGPYPGVYRRYGEEIVEVAKMVVANDSHT